MRVSLARPLLLLIFVGCQAEAPGVRASPAERLIEGDAAVGYEASSQVGGVPLTVRFRAVNRYGAPIAATPAPIQVDGLPLSILIDPGGYGHLELDEPGIYEIFLQEEAPSSEASVLAVAEAQAWSGLPLQPAVHAPNAGASHAAALTLGAAVAVGDEVWWVSSEGGSHRVLKADAPIQGIRARHIDVDPFLDLIAWTATELFLLQGHSDGGLSWGGGYRAPGFSIAAVDAGDLDGDQLADLAIAWVGEEGDSLLDVHHGDGRFGFEPTIPSLLQQTPSGLGIGDNIGSGQPQLTILEWAGGWVRYLAARSPDRPQDPSQYVRVGPAPPTALFLEEGSTLDADGDLDGDGADQLWIYGPRTGGERSVYLVNLQGRRTEYLPMSANDPFLARADADGDGLLDLLLLHGDATLHGMHFEPSSRTFIPRSLGTLVEHAPFAMGDFVGGSAPDLLVAGDGAWRFWEGAHDPTDSRVFWTLLPTDTQEAGVSAGGLMGVTDPGEALGLATVEQADGISRLVLHRWNGSALVRRGQVQLSPEGVLPVDMARCEQVVWVLLPEEVVRVAVGNLGSPNVTGRAPASGTRISCGEGPDGAEAAVLGAGQITLFGAGLAELGSAQAGGAMDLALGDVGEGPEIGLCHTEGCEVVYWPWGEDGQGSFARVEGGLLTLDPGRSFAVRGEPSLGDVDGDGLLDLLLSEPGGGVTVLRSSGMGPIPPQSFHVPTALWGAAAAGEGVIGWVDPEGQVHLSRP